jgi:hypothetical protein
MTERKVVRPGSFCHDGDRGVFASGTGAVCNIADAQTRARWRRDPSEPPAPRKPRSAKRGGAATTAAPPPAVEPVSPDQPPLPAMPEMPAAPTEPTPTHQPTIPPPTEPPAEPVSGELNTGVPLDVNGWGFDMQRPTAYHPDGPIGTALFHMGADARIDIDGQPLANVLGRAATDVVMGRRTTQQGIDTYRRIRDRLPAGSEARTWLTDAIGEMDAPPATPPALPAEVPEPVHTLMRRLYDVPLARREGDRREIDALNDIVGQFMTGRIGGGRFANAVEQRVWNRRHESFGDSGKCEIDDAVQRCVTELNEIKNDKGRRHLLNPPGR